MEATIVKQKDTVLVSPIGRLDTVSSAELKKQLEEADINGYHIDLNFENVEYISSAGLRLLVALQKEATETGHTLVVRNINKVVNEVFKVAGFHKVLTVL